MCGRSHHDTGGYAEFPPGTATGVVGAIELLLTGQAGESDHVLPESTEQKGRIAGVFTCYCEKESSEFSFLDMKIRNMLQHHTHTHTHLYTAVLMGGDKLNSYF